MEPLRLPRAVALLGLVALLAAANRFTPGMVQAVLVLLGTYLVLTHGGQVGAAIMAVPQQLGEELRAPRVAAGRAGRPS